MTAHSKRKKVVKAWTILSNYHSNDTSTLVPCYTDKSDAIAYNENWNRGVGDIVPVEIHLVRKGRKG